MPTRCQILCCCMVSHILFTCCPALCVYMVSETPCCIWCQTARLECHTLCSDGVNHYVCIAPQFTLCQTLFTWCNIAPLFTVSDTVYRVQHSTTVYTVSDTVYMVKHSTTVYIVSDTAYMVQHSTTVYTVSGTVYMVQHIPCLYHMCQALHMDSWSQTV